MGSGEAKLPQWRSRACSVTIASKEELAPPSYSKEELVPPSSLEEQQARYVPAVDDCVGGAPGTLCAWCRRLLGGAPGTLCAWYRRLRWRSTRHAMCLVSTVAFKAACCRPTQGAACCSVHLCPLVTRGLEGRADSTSPHNEQLRCSLLGSWTRASCEPAPALFGTAQRFDSSGQKGRVIKPSTTEGRCRTSVRHLEHSADSGVRHRMRSTSGNPLPRRAGVSLCSVGTQRRR